MRSLLALVLFGPMAAGAQETAAHHQAIVDAMLLRDQASRAPAFALNFTLNDRYSFLKKDFEISPGVVFDYRFERSRVRLGAGYSHNTTTGDNLVTMGLNVKVLEFGRRRR